MHTISYTAARNHLAETMSKACYNHAPIIITRSNADPVVMMSLEDFHAMEETAYLLKSPVNAHRLLKAIDEIETMIKKKKKSKKKK